MFIAGQTVTIVSAPAAYPRAPGQTGTVNYTGVDPVYGRRVYSVLTRERVATMRRTRPGGVGSMSVDLYECHGLGDLDLLSAPQIGDRVDYYRPDGAGPYPGEIVGLHQELRPDIYRGVRVDVQLDGGAVLTIPLYEPDRVHASESGWCVLAAPAAPS